MIVKTSVSIITIVDVDSQGDNVRIGSLDCDAQGVVTLIVYLRLRCSSF